MRSRRPGSATQTLLDDRGARSATSSSGLPTMSNARFADTQLLQRSRDVRRGPAAPLGQLTPVYSSDSHFTGTSAGAPLSLIMTTRNFAGLVLLAFRSTT